MAIPETIPVRYSEEEAGYVSFRPVIRQTFRINDLLDMVLTVTGKEPARIRRILRSGTVVFHSYRYWWEGFEPAEEELGTLLERFPDADPLRPFCAQGCAIALIETAAPTAGASVALDRAGAGRPRWLRRRSVWDALLAAAAAGPLAYSGYSYQHHGDLYRLELNAELRATLAAAAASLAPRNLRWELRALDNAASIVFVCPRVAL
jgi:hypothetical protein